jgi:hypothetical protein
MDVLRKRGLRSSPRDLHADLPPAARPPHLGLLVGFLTTQVIRLGDEFGRSLLLLLCVATGSSFVITGEAQPTSTVKDEKLSNVVDRRVS